MHPPWFSAFRILHESTASIAIGPDFKPDNKKNATKRIKTCYSGIARKFRHEKWYNDTMADQDMFVTQDSSEFRHEKWY